MNDRGELLRNRLVAFALLALCADAIVGAGPCRGQPVADDREIQLGFGLFHAQGTKSGSASGDLSAGYYLPSPAWQVGVRQGLTYQFNDNAPDVWAASTVPFVSYHFLNVVEDHSVVPFLGAFAGAVWNDRDASGTAGPSLGIKLFLTPHTLLAIQYRFEWFFSQLAVAGSTTSSDGNHVATVGLGYVWGGESSRRDSAARSALQDQADRIAARAEAAAARAEEAAEAAAGAADRIEKLVPEEGIR